MKKTSKFVSVLLLLMPLAMAQQGTVTKEGGGWTQVVTGSLSGARNLRVRVEAGGVRVEGGQQAGISYTYRTHTNTSSEEKARRQFDAYKINASVRGDTAWLEAEWGGGGSRRIYGDFVITVPRDTESVKIETGGGSLFVNGIAGRLEAKTGGGKVHIENIGGAVMAETGGDTIEAMAIGGDLSVETGGGKLDLGSVKGLITASTGGGDILVASGERGATLESGGGNIEVKQCGGALKVSTGGGNIEIGDVSGPAEIDTGGGSIRVGSTKGLVRAETGAGHIELNGVPSARAESGAGGIVARFVAGSDRVDSRLETAVGDITVYLAPNMNITVRASIEMASGHKIYSDFPEFKVTTEGDWGAQTAAAEGSLNGGGPLLKVLTASGNVWIRRTER